MNYFGRFHGWRVLVGIGANGRHPLQCGARGDVRNGDALFTHKHAGADCQPKARQMGGTSGNAETRGDFCCPAVQHTPDQNVWNRAGARPHLSKTLQRVPKEGGEGELAYGALEQ